MADNAVVKDSVTKTAPTTLKYYRSHPLKTALSLNTLVYWGVMSRIKLFQQYYRYFSQVKLSIFGKEMKSELLEHKANK